MKLTRYTLLFVALVLSQQALAQRDTTRSSYNESVYVQGDFKPVIEKSFKLNVAPSIVDTAETMKHSFTYGITPQRITSIFNPSRLGYVKISEPPQRLYNNYIRLGMGNYWTPMADLYYNSTRSKTLNYGARLYHQSSWGKIGKAADPDSLPSPSFYGKNHFSTTDLSLFGKYILKQNHQFSADFDYANDYNMYYGFSDSTLFARTAGVHDSLDKALYGIVYNDVNFRVGAKSLNTDLNKFGYDANVSVGNLWGRYGMSELNYSLDGTVHYGFPFLKQSKGIAYLRLGFDGWNTRSTPKYSEDSVWQMPYQYMPIVANTYSYLDTTYSASRYILRANPYIDFIFRRFQVHAGVKLDFDKFSYVDSLRFCPFPEVILTTNFMDDALNISFGLTGDLEANDWNRIRLINPYVAPFALERATKHWDVYGHMRLTFSKKLELNVRAQLSQIKDDLNFALDTTYQLSNVFQTDFVTYTRAMLGADFTFVNDEMISLTLGGHYYGYISDEDLRYRPNWDASIKANINYKDKVRAHLEGLLLGRMTGEWNDVNQENDVLPIRTGLNLEVEYLHTRALSFFVKLDNILCQRYFYWSNYPSQRLNAMLGLTYTIPTKRH